MNGTDTERKDSVHYSDQDLIDAATRVRNVLAELDALPEDEKHTFSTHFLLEMDSLIRRVHIRYSLKKCAQSVAAAILLLLISSTAWLTFNVEARADFLQWARNEYEDSIIYRFFNRNELCDTLSINVNWLPDGFEKNFSEYSNGSGVLLFTDESGHEIIFSYYIIADGMSTSITSNENTVHKDVTVCGSPADFYESSDENDSNMLWWIDEDIGIAFELNAFLPEEEMLKIAKNVQISIG